MPLFRTKRKTSKQIKSPEGLFGQYDSGAPPLQKPKRELTWFSDWAPFGIQFRIWFFILVGLIIVGTIFFYRYDPFHSDKDTLFKSIALFNNAIMLTDPQGTGDYFSYWNEDILAMFKEGLTEFSRLGIDFIDFENGFYSNNVFSADKRLSSLYNPYESLILKVEKEFSDYMLRKGLLTTPEETEYYQNMERYSVIFGPPDINQWFIYWNSNKNELKKVFNIKINEEPFITR